MAGIRFSEVLERERDQRADSYSRHDSEEQDQRHCQRTPCLREHRSDTAEHEEEVRDGPEREPLHRIVAVRVVMAGIVMAVIVPACAAMMR